VLYLFPETLNMPSRFYTMYDATNARFGIAQTEFTNATTN
jgi:hypothetical protein